MILAPSEIHFLKDTKNGLLSPDQRTIADLSSRFHESKEKIPKVQVAEKDGLWFALNNSYLHIIRDLERQGKCPQITVEVVPLTKVPENVQRGMVVGREDCIVVDGETEAAAATIQQSQEESDDEWETEDGSEEEPADAATVAALDTSQVQPYFGFVSVLSALTSLVCYRVTKQGSHCKVPASNASATEKGSQLASMDAETDGTSSYSSTDYSDYDQEDEEEETESEFDDALTCNVCDRSFNSTRQLAQHQQKKRHFGCSICNSSFPSLLALEHHKEALDHWSEDEGNTYESDSDDDSDDDDATPGNKRPDEMERLL